MGGFISPSSASSVRSVSSVGSAAFSSSRKEGRLNSPLRLALTASCLSFSAFLDFVLRFPDFFAGFSSERASSSSSSSSSSCRIFSALFSARIFLRSSFCFSLSGCASRYASRPSLAASANRSRILFINPKKDLCVMMIIDTSNTRTMITTPPTVPNADAVEMQTAPPSTPPPVWYSELSA